MQLDRPQVSQSEFEVQIRTFNECLLYLVVNMKVSHHYHTSFILSAMSMVGYLTEVRRIVERL